MFKMVNYTICGKSYFRIRQFVKKLTISCRKILTLSQIFELISMQIN